MDSRIGRWSIILLASALVWATLVGAGAVRAANAPPLANAWNIASSGKAASSGELLFRVSAGDEEVDPVEVTVFVLSGANETGVASSIRRALSTQLDSRRYNVSSGEGANVLVTNASGSAGFVVELIDSDVENLSVRVQNATPAASPTVPAQQIPAEPPANQPKPPQPGNALPPPGESQPPAPTPDPGPSPLPGATPNTPTPPSAPPAPPASPSTPPAGAGTDEAGAAASAPPSEAPRTW